MERRKLVFNIYDREKHPITNELIKIVMEEIPFQGAIMFTLKDGRKLMASRHDRVKHETYDVYWNMLSNEE